MRISLNSTTRVDELHKYVAFTTDLSFRFHEAILKEGKVSSFSPLLFDFDTYFYFHAINSTPRLYMCTYTK